MTAVFTCIQVSPQRGGPADLDGAHGAELIEGKLVSLSVCGAVLLEDSGDFRRHEGLRHGEVEGAYDFSKLFLADMEVDRGCLRRLMAQEQLHMVQIGPCFKEMGGKAVSERMDGCRLGDTRAALHHLEHLLDRGGGKGFLAGDSGEEPHNRLVVP